jgi:Mor family transcriptional regulator
MPDDPTHRETLLECLQAIVKANHEAHTCHDYTHPEGQRAALRHALRKTIEIFCEYFGGRQIYHPSLDHMLRPDLDRQIYNRFTGTNHNELAALFGLARATIYRAIERHAATLTPITD